MTLEKLEQIGWKQDGWWNNRMMFSMSRDSRFAIFEHNGEFGVMDPFTNEFSLIYCNLSDENIEKFSELVKKYDDMEIHPDDYKFSEYLEVKNKINEFLTKARKYEEDFEFEL